MADKAFYKIGEACKRLDIQPYVLRYWETEFPILKPDTSKSGQRVYSQEDMGVIQRVKELLYDEGFTIAGAKKKLEAESADGRQMTLDAPTPPAKTAGPKPVPVPDPEPEATVPPKKESKPVSKASDKAADKKEPEKKAPEKKASEKTAKASAKKTAPAKTTQKATAKKSATKAAGPAVDEAALAAAEKGKKEAENRAKDLEKGVRSALKEARAILSILQAEPAPPQATQSKKK